MVSKRVPPIPRRIEYYWTSEATGKSWYAYCTVHWNETEQKYEVDSYCTWLPSFDSPNSAEWEEFCEFISWKAKQLTDAARATLAKQGAQA